MKLKRQFLFVLIGLMASLGARGQSLSGRVIDALRYEVDAELVPDRAFLRGEALVRFKVLQDTLNLPFSLNSRLTLTGVFVDDERLSSRYDDFNSNRMLVRRDEPFVSGTEYTIRFTYEGNLETEQYAFLDTPERSPAFITRSEAILLSEGHWFPSHDFPIDTAPVRLRIAVPLGFSVVAPGVLTSIETLGITEAFNWESERPVGEAPVIVARFLREKFEDDGLPLTFFIREDLDLDLAPLVAATKKIATFYANEFGDLPVRELSLAQVGNVELSGKGSLGLVLLESSLLEQPEVPLMKLAQRIALQWWAYSGSIGASSDAWLRDGFATYAALRFFEVLEPARYSQELALQAVAALKYQDRSPVSEGLRLDVGTVQYDSIVASKGAWILNMLGQLIGKDKFDSSLGDWYERSLEQVSTTETFRAFAEQLFAADLSWFFLQWVESVGVPEFRVDYTIYKKRDGSFRIQGQLKQDIDLFRMPVDILIETKGKPEEKKIDIKGRQTSFNFETQTLPMKLTFDPHGKILIETESMRLRVLLAIGDEFLAQSEFIAAIAEYTKAKNHSPRSSLVHYRLGEAYFKQVSLNLAANSFRDCLNGDLKPDWIEAWSHIYLGKIFDVLGQRQRAMAEYQKAINTQVDYLGAQDEARKYLKTPFTKPSSLIN